MGSPERRCETCNTEMVPLEWALRGHKCVGCRLKEELKEEKKK